MCISMWISRASVDLIIRSSMSCNVNLNMDLIGVKG